MALASLGHAWRLSDLLAGLIDLSAPPASIEDRQVSDLALDGRTLIPGALFLACQGEAVHGLAFAEEARRRGAVAILAETSDTWTREAILQLNDRLGLPVIPVDCLADHLSAIADRFYGSPSASLDVLGVVSGQGEQGIGHLLAQALHTEQACALVGWGIGFPGDLQGSHGSDLDPLALQWTLDHLLGRGARAVALEMALSSSSWSRVAAIHFDCLVLAGLPQHGDDPSALHPALQALLSKPGSSQVVLDLDAPGSQAVMAALPSGISVAGYSLRPDARAPQGCDLLLRALSITARPLGLRIEVERCGGEAPEQARLDVGLIGRTNAASILAVMTIICARGGSLERAARELAHVRGVPGCLEPFGGESAPLVVVDSARDPQALETALRALRLHDPRRLICVMGCRDGTSAAQRSRMGEIAERLCDRLILTDDNPGEASAEAIIADILSGVARPERVSRERQRGLAIRLAIALAGIGDAVLIAGKGQETTQDMGDLKVHFSDRAQVVEALREWREGHH